MHLNISYYASLRESLGKNTDTFDFTGTVITVLQLRDQLRAKGEPYASAFAIGKPIRCAVNQAVVKDDMTIQAGDEIAFFPPVTGG